MPTSTDRELPPLLIPFLELGVSVAYSRLQAQGGPTDAEGGWLSKDSIEAVLSACLSTLCQRYVKPQDRYVEPILRVARTSAVTSSSWASPPPPGRGAYTSRPAHRVQPRPLDGDGASSPPRRADRTPACTPGGAGSRRATAPPRLASSPGVRSSG